MFAVSLEDPHFEALPGAGSSKARETISALPLPTSCYISGNCVLNPYISPYDNYLCRSKGLMESHAAHGMYAGLSFDRSLGHRKFGKTTVDCGFLSSKSQWGTLDAKSAGLLRLKLNFHEPAEYKLASAEAHLRFLPSDGGASPEITEHLYPETIYGLPLSQQQSVNYNIEPSFQAMGIGAGGLGWHRAAQRERVHRWLLKGSRLPDKDGLYTNAEWSVISSEIPKAASSVKFAVSEDKMFQAIVL